MYFSVNKSMRTHTPQVNHVSLKFPKVPILSQPCDVDPEAFCGNLQNTDCSEEYCECTVVYKVALGAVVELILIDLGKFVTF